MVGIDMNVCVENISSVSVLVVRLNADNLSALYCNADKIASEIKDNYDLTEYNMLKCIVNNPKYIKLAYYIIMNVVNNKHIPYNDIVVEDRKSYKSYIRSCTNIANDNHCASITMTEDFLHITNTGKYLYEASNEDKEFINSIIIGHPYKTIMITDCNSVIEYIKGE